MSGVFPSQKAIYYDRDHDSYKPRVGFHPESFAFHPFTSPPHQTENVGGTVIGYF